jgi:iron complex outermembrane receptor protein
MVRIIKNGNHLFINSLIASLLVFGFLGDVLAKEKSGETDEFTLEEIVVTAQRRIENLQNTAIAATAIQGDELNDKAVVNFVDLQFAAPSITITDGLLSKSVNIRGIGLASGSPAVTNGVATYIDGVFQPPIAGTGSFFDIQDVEVLRGPQGTFVGSNSTGGAVFINSRSPSLENVEGYVQGTLGDYSARGFQAAISTPVSSIFALRFAGNYQYHDAYYNDIGPANNEPGKLDEKSGRISALLKTDKFKGLLKVSETNMKTGGYAVQPIGTLASGRDIYTVEYNSKIKNDEKAKQSTLELNYNLPGDITLRSISGYQNKQAWNLYDFDATATASDGQDQYVRERVYTEEINLISPSEGRLDWVLGGYYQRNKIDVVIDQPAIAMDVYDDKVTRGLFGQVGYKLTEALKADFGMRYSDYEVEQEGAVVLKPGMAFPGSPEMVLADLKGDHNDSAPTGKFALNWTVNQKNLIYGFVARGYKSGGFNSVDNEFDPEYVWNYEAGWKSTLLDGHMRTQSAVFWMDYSDFQLDRVDTATGQNGLANITDGTVKGFELNAQGQFEAIGFDMGYSYVDSELGSFEYVNTRVLTGSQFYPSCDLVPGGIPGVTCTDYSGAISVSDGTTMLFSPKHTFNAGINYMFYLKNGMVLRPRINYSYIAGQWINLNYNPALDYLKSRGLWSATITLNALKWQVEAYCNNLLDKEYVAGQFISTESYGRPREIGVRVSYYF